MSKSEISSPAPAWQKALPFVALLPAASLTNGSLLSLVVVVLSLILVRASRGPTLALRYKGWVPDLALGAAVGAVLWAFGEFLMDPALQHFLGKIQLGGYEGVKGNLAGFFILLALGFVYGGIVEETMFRGFVIGWGTALFGERATVPLLLLSTIVFGAGHAFYQGLAGGISTGVFGLAFGVLYLLTGRRLLPAIVCHAVADAIGVTALYLGHSG